MNALTDRARGLFACLGDASRYRIVATLSAGERCVSELARDVALSQSCTTRHLQALQRVGLVSGERQGKRVVFRLRVDDPRVDGLLEWIRRESPVDEPTAHPPSPQVGSRSIRSTGPRPAVLGATRTGAGAERTGDPTISDGHSVPTPAPEQPDEQVDQEIAPERPPRRSQDLEDFLL